MNPRVVEVDQRISDVPVGYQADDVDQEENRQWIQ